MWEQIRANKRKSVALVLMMAALLLTLGFVIGEAVVPRAGWYGLAIAALVWAVMSLAAYFQGGNLLLAVSGAKKIEKEDHPQLFNVVEEMKIASGLPRMPAVYIVNDASLNAFAVGRNPDRAAVAVTRGMLGELNRDELQGVVAHEVAHVVNRDVLLMTMMGVMLGSIVMVSEIFLRGMFYSGGGRSRRYSSDSKGGGQFAIVMMVVAVVLAILAPLLARLIYFAVSRRREYLADAHAATLTRYPAGLASALERLGESRLPVAKANKATASMYIVNPFAKSSLYEMTSTHPPLSERIEILRALGGSVSYAGYQNAWASAGRKRAGKLPGSVFKNDKVVATREAHPEAVEQQNARHQMRMAGDAIRKANGFLFLPCVCGLRIKLPPNFEKDSVTCPRCKRALVAPMAQLAAAMTAMGALENEAIPAAQEAPLQVKLPGEGWRSFLCSCGATKTIAPTFSAKRVQCGKCKRNIEITR